LFGLSGRGLLGAFDGYLCLFGLCAKSFNSLALNTKTFERCAEFDANFEFTLAFGLEKVYVLLPV
jgi:hypothetical protein